ncbi:MAG: ATP phosphoribosyltransferase [Methylococcales symbiont of Hymedesmia sp. n. MRB-2018]|nr:MAG: ATP phosphoribosyltransferase [Methylococcales symbiont of Hymedesmia sp. n. MRB-2018]KAF3984628.1 MAG: ATP phosphoribosyltransferase [Methylococcales symbiont of Hymedesmia sp. n. MRB-2018]
MLTIAISKGRIYDDTLPLLAEAGIIPIDNPKTSRKLILRTNQDDVKLVIIRATDVPTFVEYGAADMGIAGKDVLMEHGAENLYEPLDLGIAKCRMMTATPVNAPEISGRIKVATKYVKTAQRYFAGIGVQAEIIKLYGAMELAPLVGLADCIVDIVETGNTLKANGLVAKELITHISSRLVVNKASMKMKHGIIQPLIDQFEKTIENRH